MTTQNPPTRNTAGDKQEQGQRPGFAPREIMTPPPSQHNARHWIHKVLFVAGFAGVAFVAFLLFNTDRNTRNIDFNINQTITDQVSLTIEGATYKGQTAEGAPFVVFADKVGETLKNRHVVQLLAPRARLDTDAPLTIRSNHARYDRNTDHIQLGGRVVIVSPESGQTLHTEAALVELDSGDITSDTPVQGYAPNGTVSSEGMAIRDQGNRVVFTGQSRLILHETP